MVLKRIGVLSFGAVTGGIYAVLGLVFGGIFSLISFFGAALGAGPGAESALLGLLFGVGAIVIMPIMYGVMGFLMGLLVSALYNGMARLFGGIKLDLV